MLRISLENWNIAIRKGTAGKLIKDVKSPFHVIKNDRYSWIADPFLFEKDDIIYIFAERYDYRLLRGVIAYTVYDSITEKISDWHNVIIEDWHLSFPFIFTINNNIYIIPESNVSNRLFVYKAIEFPDVWEKKVIYQGRRFADTAIIDDKTGIYVYSLEHNPKNIEEQWAVVFKMGHTEQEKISETCEFFIKTKIEKYSTNPETRRLGGAFFKWNNKMIKVAQDCKDTYGKRLVFQEFNISALQKIFFSDKNINSMNKHISMIERKIQTISCEDITTDLKKRKWSGIHTYNSNGKYEIIDLKGSRISLIQWLFRFLRKLNIK